MLRKLGLTGVLIVAVVIGASQASAPASAASGSAARSCGGNYVVYCRPYHPARPSRWNDYRCNSDWSLLYVYDKEHNAHMTARRISHNGFEARIVRLP